MPPQQGTYQPVGVPAVTPKHPGLIQGTIGIICAVIALLILPPVFGVAGIILGVLSLRKGEQALGITAIVLSAVFMILGFLFGAYVALHPDMFKADGSAVGAVIQAFR